MRKYLQNILRFVVIVLISKSSFAQKNEMVKVVQSDNENKIDVFVGDKLFTTFLYPDSLEKPILFPVYSADGTMVTRGFPLDPQPNEPNDHPHHTGIWFTYENINGIDFWNNSYAIPKDKKHLYGRIRTDSVMGISGNKKGTIIYHSNWIDHNKNVLLEETTYLDFSGTEQERIIDRATTLRADTAITFNDAKDGLYGIRLALALQIPDKKDEQSQHAKGNTRLLRGTQDSIANGNYVTSEGKYGDSAWGTQGRWCKVYGKMGKDSVSIVMIDNPKNPGYPTFWHARGYGLFAANPLGKKIFTKGKSSENLQLKKGESVTFYYRIIIENGSSTLSAQQINKLADDFAKERN